MESRKRLSPWLRKKVEAGNFGLKWVNREEQLFSIPWMHKSNKAWNKEHCGIFKEWAKFTNRYKEGDTEDWPGWKSRFRSALNKLCDFEQVPEYNNLTDTENPYKVFRFVNTEKLKKDFSDSSSSSVVDSPGTSHSSPGSSQASSSFDALDSSPSPKGNYYWHGAMNIPTILAQSNENFDGNLPNIQVCNEGMQTNLVGELQSMVSGEKSIDSSGIPSDLASLDPDNLISNAKMPSDDFLLYKANMDIPKPNMDIPKPNMDIPKPKIILKIFFLDEMVKQVSLDDEGARLYFGDIPNCDFPVEVLGPSNLRKIEFPDVNNMQRSINSDQQRHIQDILLNMNRGFLLQYYNGDIYAQRLCRTRIFYWNSLTGSNVLDRASKKPTKVFDFTEFQKGLENSSNVIPETILTFGQELKMNCLKKLLVHVEITHVEAFDYKEQKYPSSNKSSSIMFSDIDLEDRILQSMQEMNLEDKK